MSALSKWAACGLAAATLVFPQIAAAQSTPEPTVPATKEAAPVPAPPAVADPISPSPTPEKPAAHTPAPVGEKKEEKKEKGFWDRFKIRGYTQFRYNRLFASNDRLVNAQGDRYIGPNTGLAIRRARLILQGDVHDHLAVYLQTDFASVINDQFHVPTIRDWYADIFLDKTREFRFRIGQSKIPFGFENMQSSQNRIAFDRTDALNSALRDERDLGIFFYWAPAHIRERFKKLVDDGLKGSGDYGVVGLGFFNGQTANRPELNDNRHVVARVTWPFQFGHQFLELGTGGYIGKFRVKKDPGVTGKDDFLDMRAHAAFVLYPQPFGLQAEYNIGRGPEYVNGEVLDGFLHGGYVLASYKIGPVFPYVRGSMYDGGKKFENNSPRYHVRELEMGAEWEIIKAVEVTAAFTLAKRTAPTLPYEVESGRLFRLQLQVNY